MTVHEAVRELREDLQLSQQAFATTLGLSISAIQNYEKNRVPVPHVLGKMIRLATRHDMFPVAETLRKTLREQITDGDPEDRMPVNNHEHALADLLLIACRNTHIPTVNTQLRAVITALTECANAMLQEREDHIRDAELKEVLRLRTVIQKASQTPKPKQRKEGAK